MEKRKRSSIGILIVRFRVNAFESFALTNGGGRETRSTPWHLHQKSEGH